MTLDHIIRLSQVKTASGGQRFYPIGQHPATYKQRMVLKKLYEMPDSDDVKNAIEYYERAIVGFEIGEDLAKMRYIRMWRQDAQKN